MPAANDLTSAPITVTVEELDSAYDVLHRLGQIKAHADETDWYVLMAARLVVNRARMIAKYGSVPGE